MRFKLWLEEQGCSGGYGPVYHGSANDFEQFDPKVSNFGGTIYFSTDPTFAYEFATNSKGAGGGKSGFVYTACLNIQKTFDPTNAQMIEELRPILLQNVQNNLRDQTTGMNFSKDPLKAMPLSKFDSSAQPEEKITTDEQAVNYFMWRIQTGSWRIIEAKPILDYIKSRGYDSLVTAEMGAKNIAIFDPSLAQIIDKKPVQPAAEEPSGFGFGQS